MDTQKHEGFADNTGDEIIPKTSTTEYVDEPTTFTPNPEITVGKEIVKEPIQVTANLAKGENKTALTANVIAIVGLFINLVLAIFTYLLFQKTVEATEISQKALVQSTRANDISAQALAGSRRADSLSDIKDSVSYEFSRKQYLDNRKKDSITIAMTRQSVDAQISSLRETQNQFQIENLAYIECADFVFTNFETNKQPRLSFKIANIGRAPIQVMKFKFFLYYSGATIGFNPEGYLNPIPYDPLPTSFYVTKEFPRTQYFTSSDIMPVEEFNNIKNEKILMFFCGEIKYVNQMNLKKMKYTFNVLLYPPPSNEFRILFLNNIEDK
jgi:hypothetical protein